MSLLLGKSNICSSKGQRDMPFLQGFIARTRRMTPYSQERGQT